MNPKEQKNRASNQENIIELIKNNGVKSTTKRAFRYIIVKLPIQLLPTENIPLPALCRLFELRAAILPRVSDKNPLELVWLSSDKVEYLHPPGSPRPPDRYGYVIGGEWDQNKIEFDNYFAYRSLVNRYKNGLNWEETELFKWRQSNIKGGNSRRGLSSTDELREYLNGIDELYESISSGEYKTQRELMKHNPAQARLTNNDSFHPVLHEICVNIGRNGELIKRGSGQHRLSIAKILDLDEVPVIVKTRHSEWQQIRNEIRSKSDPEELTTKAKSNLNHPDLADIVPEEWLE